MSQDPRTEDEKAKDYQRKLYPWCLVQHLPKMQNRTVARFRRRNDADAHQRILRQLIPLAQYTIVFDPGPTLIGTEANSRDGKAIKLPLSTTA
ncbi:MAG: hypothetical protein AAF716_09470 [Cyanobacteria bacterium P01_D01_bin.1]